MNTNSEASEAEVKHCIEVAEQFSKTSTLWPMYVDLVRGLKGVDLDFEISGEPSNAYITFMGNDVRGWLSPVSADIGENHLFIAYCGFLRQRRPCYATYPGRPQVGPRSAQ
ncbi:MAG: hypothetical protein CSA70_11570 [Rhodobacterales bacterium]|nr:MAG: hypothetical protein CR984_01145 [Pseudomonadota bacterium]PIE10645.1 MAG: hypothetical protein CSA70_11570 [Rhodobacterales bacterium]